MKPTLTLYTSATCDRCVDVWVLLAALAEEFDWDIAKVDVNDEPELQAHFGPLVPVVDIMGGPALYGEISADAILEALADVQA